jgi:threonine/homoserine/homoserine lactone efflux protein
MSLEVYLSFVLATTLLILFPGPSVMLTISHSLSWGARRALLSVAGASLAVVVQLVVLAAGLTTVMVFAAQWLEVIRWAGVAYLVAIGVVTWRSAAQLEKTGATRWRSGRGLFVQGFVVSLLNPKSLLFYAAFFPHFVDPQRAPGPQLAILCVTFLVIAAGLTAGYAVLANQVGAWFAGPRGARVRLRATGSIMIGAGLVLAVARR